MKKQAFTALFVAALTIGMASMVTAETADATETSDINVTVSAETALDVKPDQLDYTGVAVGDRKTETSNAINYTQLKVENTGSNDIQRIWADVSTPSSNPFGQGDANVHDSANFLQIAPYDPNGLAGLNGQDTFHYVERIEFFQERSPLVDIGSMNTTYSDVEVGRVRFGNNEFYFALGHDGSSCQEIRVANSPTVPDSLGTNDFSIANTANWANYSMGASGDAAYQITNESVQFDLQNVEGINNAETHDYDIMATCGTGNLGSISGLDEEHLRLVRYNIDPNSVDNLVTGNGEVSEAIWDTQGGAVSDQLHPGQSFSVNVSVQVPRGVPAGDITEGTMTVYSQAFTG